MPTGISTWPTTLDVIVDTKGDSTVSAADHPQHHNLLADATLSLEKAFLRRVFSLKAYGSANDGVTDDTLAWNSAVTDIGTAGGGILLVPTGTTLLGPPNFTSNMWVLGAGESASTLKLKNGVNATFLGPANLADVNVSDLTIDGNAANNPTGAGSMLIFYHSDRCKARRVRVINPSGIPISVVGSRYCLVDACYVDGTGGGALTGIWVAFDTNVHPTGSQVRGCWVLNTGHDGMTLDGDDITVSDCYVSGAPFVSGVGYSGIYVGQSRNRVKIEGCTCVSNGNYGIDFDNATANTSYGCAVVGNTCNGNRNAGIGCSSKGATIQGNTCTNNGQTISGGAPTSPYGIEFDADDIIVTGNICHDTQVTHTQTYGIFGSNLFSNNPTRGIVAWNNMRGNATAGFGQAGTGVHYVERNQGYSEVLTATAAAGAATLHSLSGIVTSEALTTAAGGDYTLTLTNSLVAAGSLVTVSLANGTNTTVPIMTRLITPGAGSVVIIVRNEGAAALNGTIKIGFHVMP